MSFDNYLNRLYIKYIYGILDNIDDMFNEYNKIIIKQEGKYINIINEINLELLTESDIALLKDNYNDGTLELTDEIINIFDLYLNKLKLIPLKRVYYKLNDGDINPNHVANSKAVIIVINIKIDYNLDFNLFLQKYNNLKLQCKKIEQEINLKKKIEIKFLFNILDEKKVMFNRNE